MLFPALSLFSNLVISKGGGGLTRKDNSSRARLLQQSGGRVTATTHRSRLGNINPIPLRGKEQDYLIHPGLFLALASPLGPTQSLPFTVLVKPFPSSTLKCLI